MTLLDIRQRAKELVDQLPDNSLYQAVESLEALHHQNPKSKSPSESDKANEAELLRIIQRQLSPEEQNRIDYLRQCNEAENITPEEHEELLSYVERIEQQDAQRATALIQLAQLHQVDLDSLLAEFLPERA